MWNLKAFCHTGILPALYGKEVVGSSLTDIRIGISLIRECTENC